MSSSISNCRTCRDSTCWRSFRDEEALSIVPVVVFTGRELSPEEDAQLHTMARSVVVKGVESPERLLDETALFLHRIISDLPPAKQRMLERLHNSDDTWSAARCFWSMTMRATFLLSAACWSGEAWKCLRLRRAGRRSLCSKSTADVAIVLMDIMMPEMDGYQTTQAIRSNARFRRLPIITLTAKAMKGDREKCLEAGASDYLAKPVNTEQLLSALRMWLHR